MSRSMKNKTNVRSMALMALLAAIICILAFTPFIGYIPLGFTRATIVHIPVIIASLLLGPKKGAALGFLFGLTSFINNTMNPTPTSFMFTPFFSLGETSGNFSSLIICFVPRILVGVVPYYVYQFCQKLSKKEEISQIGLILSGIYGSLTNTLLVMNLTFIFFKEEYALANNKTVSAVYGFILSIIGINGVPEAIIAGILTLFIGRILLKKRGAFIG